MKKSPTGTCGRRKGTLHGSESHRRPNVVAGWAVSAGVRAVQGGRPLGELRACGGQWDRVLAAALSSLWPGKSPERALGLQLGQTVLIPLRSPAVLAAGGAQPSGRKQSSGQRFLSCGQQITTPSDQ